LDFNTYVAKLKDNLRELLKIDTKYFCKKLKNSTDYMNRITRKGTKSINEILYESNYRGCSF